MHIYFSGIGGAGIGPLALLASQAGFKVSGSDKQDSQYIEYLKSHGVKDITIGQTTEDINQVHSTNPVDWLVYSSALPKENPNHPELVFASQHNIKNSKRDEFLNYLLSKTNKKLIAVAGTHGKTTTTAMLIWLFKQLDIPVSYSVGAKMSFGDMGQFESDSQYFIYEADEYDHNFLSFSPAISVIPGIDWDHPDIYPTRESYYQAFRTFIGQSEQTILWQEDADRIDIRPNSDIFVLDKNTNLEHLSLIGEVNRRNAHAAVVALEKLNLGTYSNIAEKIQDFPGVSRRFEKIKHNIYTDYAHTPEKIKGALQLAREVARDNLVVVYEGLHNTRQHFIRDDLKNLFSDVKNLYIVPSYLAREDPSLEMLTPDKLADLTDLGEKAVASELNDKLLSSINTHASNNDLVLCLSAGGGGSLDEWLRFNFKN